LTPSPPAPDTLRAGPPAPPVPPLGENEGGIAVTKKIGRRSFLKKGAAVLPALAVMGFALTAARADCNDNCSGSCYEGCTGSCMKGCTGSCEDGCTGSCMDGCTGGSK
jgi:CXXX repeat radical SAM target protein